jgi:hypothetical protein
MPTQRGFLERLEVGRAGLVVAAVLHDDGSRANYQIPDLDADPERFNERLSKLGLLRDALNRGEPVELEYDQKEGTRTVERVTRITRDNLSPTSGTERVVGLVIGVAVTAENRTGPNAETSDLATVAMLLTDGTMRSFVLDLQIPERAVAEAQLKMIRDAQASGETLTLTVDAKTRRIVGAQSGGADGFGGDQGKAETLDGFVEAISHAIVPGGLANAAHILFTTAPPFSGGGNVVDLIAFTPTLVQFLVLVGSPEYELFMVGLRNKLRMRVLAGALVERPQSADRPAPEAAPRVVVRGEGSADSAATTSAAATPSVALVRGAQLLHALASASRPVWIQISRKSLDVGPEAACTEGLPSSDLTPKTLRDLHLPYSAEWIGCGCFNHGVYRFQFALDSEFAVEVDCETMCVHASADGKTQFAHACLDGEHEVRVRLAAWTCQQNFLMDVYRIR